MGNVILDIEASELLGHKCRVCLHCGATSVDDPNGTVAHYKNCSPPNPEWFIEEGTEEC